MHGPAFRGDGARELAALADGYAQRFEKSVEGARTDAND